MGILLKSGIISLGVRSEGGGCVIPRLILNQLSKNNSEFKGNREQVPHEIVMLFIIHAKFSFSIYTHTQQDVHEVLEVIQACLKQDLGDKETALSFAAMKRMLDWKNSLVPKDCIRRSETPSGLQLDTQKRMHVNPFQGWMSR